MTDSARCLISMSLYEELYSSSTSNGLIFKYHLLPLFRVKIVVFSGKVFTFPSVIESSAVSMKVLGLLSSGTLLFFNNISARISEFLRETSATDFDDNGPAIPIPFVIRSFVLVRIALLTIFSPSFT